MEEIIDIENSNGDGIEVVTKGAPGSSEDAPPGLEKTEKAKEAPQPPSDKSENKKESSSAPSADTKKVKEAPQPSSDKSENKKESSSKPPESKSKPKESGPPGSKKGSFSSSLGVSGAVRKSIRKAFEKRRPLILLDDQDEEDSEFVEQEDIRNYAKSKLNKHGRFGGKHLFN